MKSLIKIIVFLVLFNLTACSVKETYIGPKREAVAFDSKIVKQERAGWLEIVSEYSNVEIYAWDKKEIKFELTKKLRGMYDEEVLKKKVEDIKVDISMKNSDVFLASTYKGEIKNPADRSLDLKVFVPRHIEGISLKIDTGTIKVLDTVKCDIKIDTKAVNSQINGIEGKLSFKSDLGNLVVSKGRLRKGSKITSNMGNISIKADLEKDDAYSVETNVGNIELQLPEGLKATVESIGNLETNEFASGSADTKVMLKSGMGKISIKKYH